MENLQLNGFYCGVVMTERGTKEYISNKREEWVKEGRICWITREDQKYNQESLDVE